MVDRQKLTLVPKTYTSQDNKEAFDVCYKIGEYYSSVTTRHHKDEIYKERPKNNPNRTDEDRIRDMVAQRSRNIKNYYHSNKFEWCAVLSWRSKWRRMDTEYQDGCVRGFLKKLKRKYPDIIYLAIRHKNEDCEGYHIHLFISGLPRRMFRMRTGVLDDKGRQTYCFLGWRKYDYGWSSAEKVESTKNYLTYVAKWDKMWLLPKDVKSIVAYSRDLILPDKDKEVLSNEDVAKLKETVKDNVIYYSKFYIDNGIYMTGSEYTLLRGRLGGEVQHE